MDFIEVEPIGFNKKGKKFARHLLRFVEMTNKKTFKPVIFLIPENTNEVFIDVEQFVAWKKESPVNEAYCRDGALVLGRQVFVFDVNSCDFLKEDK